MTARSVCLGMLLAVAASLPGASPAKAVEHRPTGIFAPFANCPLSNPALSNPGADLCLVARITGGELVIGSRTVPIVSPLTLQGGLIEQAPSEVQFKLLAVESGSSLSGKPLEVPGGLTGVGGTRSVTKATASVELAGPASGVELNEFNLANESGVGLRLPVRAKLNSTTLGKNCYVGSASAPIVLSLTTGTTSPSPPNRPIKGAVGEQITEEAPNGTLALVVEGVDLVDNAFSVPAVTGCGAYTSIIDADLGLPSRAGRNTAILRAHVEEATVEVVKQSE